LQFVVGILLVAFIVATNAAPAEWDDDVFIRMPSRYDGYYYGDYLYGGYGGGHHGGGHHGGGHHGGGHHGGGHHGR